MEPSPTPVPLAAQVNGEGISLAEYQSELARYKDALGKELTAEDEQRVLNDLIDQTLLAQASSEEGFTLDDAALQARLGELAAGLGGDQALLAWMEEQGYTEEGFRQALARSLRAAWMRDKIAATVPDAAEQVHARQVLLGTAEQADEALGLLKGGKDFGNLAGEYDPVAGGDLGWFPRGYLQDAKLDEAAFSLEPGQYSGVIETGTGYHILQVIEREPKRPLDPDALLALRTEALRSWLETRRNQSDIQVLLS